MSFAKRMDGIGESATLKLNALAKDLKNQGKTVFNLTAGEPDFRVHPIGERAVEDALKRGLSKYTPVTGFPELRARVAQRTNRMQGLSRWKENNIVTSNGGKQAIFNTLACLVNPGDEVVIVSPYWLTYPAMVQLVDGVSKIVSTTAEHAYKMKPEQLERALTSKTRVVIINSPSNPTGATYSYSELAAFGKVIESASSKPWVISDEIYDELTYGTDGFVSFLKACPNLADRTITVNGLSKSAALTGWRLGWTVCEPNLAQTIANYQSQTTSGINALAQWAGIALIDALEDSNTREAVTHRQEFAKRRERTLEILSKGRKLKITAPMGAFYVFVDVSQCLGGAGSVDAWSERLLSQAGVAVVPGGSFGDAHAVRLSFATDEKTIQEGLQRFVEFAEGSKT